MSQLRQTTNESPTLERIYFLRQHLFQTTLGNITTGLSCLVILLASHQASGQKPTVKSFDPVELDPLSRELLDGLDDFKQPSDNRGQASAKKNQSDRKTLVPDQTLRTSESGLNPVEKIVRRMKLSEELISEQKLSEQTLQTQKEIITALANLIEQASQQQKTKQTKQPTSTPKDSPPNNSEQTTNTDTNQQSPAEAASNKSPKDQQSPDKENTLEVLQQILTGAWGHLPEQVREQLRSASDEQFLDKYELFIDAYYKRLAKRRR
ncbi:MAG: hypothetical protein MK165_07760 [Pirellulaceae bacterium]|nr:hypothetical protein [Pirellulaceae bacterium]